MSKYLALAMLLSFSAAHADEASDAAVFRGLFLNEVRALNPKAADENVRALHFLPDGAVVQALRARGLDDALAAIRSGTIPALAENTGLQSAPAAATVAGKDLTIVLVPGVFAEFIANRAFEDVLEKDSKFRDQFKALVAKNKVMDSVGLIENFKPTQDNKNQIAPTPRALDQVINVGEMKIGDVTVRVVLFFTEFSTLESLGRNEERAEIFNRRLEKYLQLTGPQQNLAFVGYSRGTPLALEMLAQAKAAGRPWIQNVKAMISLSGVVWGSSLADGAYYDEGSPMHKILIDLRETGRSLEPLPAPGESLLSAKNAPVFFANNKRWADFAAGAIENYRLMDADKSSVHTISPVKSLVLTDPRSPLSIAFKMWQKLGLEHPKRDYNLNIERFNYFVDQLLASVYELTTTSRIEWWTNHDIPLNPVYYAIPGTMANPEAGGLQVTLFENPLSYGGRDNYDDNSLLQNTLDYAKMSGISLNDSQVSVAQAAFLPNVIASLRASNAGVKTKFLGVAGTHHWGMALRVVNKNLLTGGRNGFPREAMLRALATQVMLDN
jgi:hypothetical protein